jgi:hypothetical protein
MLNRYSGGVRSNRWRRSIATHLQVSGARDYEWDVLALGQKTTIIGGSGLTAWRDNFIE